MKRIVPILAAACGLAIATPATAQDIPATPEDGGPRHFEVTGVTTALNLREEPSIEAGVAARLAPGSVLTNLGCQAGRTRVWCQVQDFRGGPVGFVDVAYLSPAAGPDGAVATGPNTSALRAGQGAFDATGTIPCALARGQPMTTCPFGVARAGGGDATMVITRADGFRRVVFFTRGVAMGVDSSEADPASFRFQATRDNDLHLIRVGDERYEIPDAAVFGG